MSGREIAGSIAEAVGQIVDAGALGGAAMLVWRDGAVRDTPCVGWRDIDAGLPIERDTIFRIASMSKPVTSVAALMLLEEGRFALSDSIARWAPEFTSPRVLRTRSGPLDDTEPAQHPITFHDLLTHRSGVTYGSFHDGPLADAYRHALGADVDSHVAPDDWIAGLAQLPLIDHPGAAFHYGHSTDLLGLLIARIDDAPLADVLQRRIFGPLGMTDTGFTVAAGARDRRACMYGFDDGGRLARRLTATGGSTLAERPDDLPFVSGGAGLWSTLDDYLAFARLFVEQGSVGGVRLLRPDTVAMMASNQLSAPQRASAGIFGMPIFAAGHGYGMGVAVVVEPERAEPTICGGGAGAVGWPGAWGSWWQADPNDRSVLIFLAHNIVEPAQWAQGVGLGVFEAITRFQRLASAAGE